MIFLYNFAGSLPHLLGSGPPLHVDPPGDEGEDSRAGTQDLLILLMWAIRFAIRSH